MWSIGIYAGESPFQLSPHPGAINPILTRESVTDVPAEFVADPFMICAGSIWYMFFEVLNQQRNKGEIGLATSANALAWEYQQIVLAEPFHLSYPYLFEWRGEYYMIPETLQAHAVSLYKADDFPRRWSLAGQLMKGSCADPSIFRFADKWWVFVCSTPYLHDTLRLYFAADLMGPWTEHPASPLVRSDKSRARPGGRVLVADNKIIRFAQDCVPRYGTQLRAFEISELTTSRYVEAENQSSPILSASGKGWNGLGMHHLDPQLMPDGQWIACVDGFADDEKSGS